MHGVVREYQAPRGVTHAVRGRFGQGLGAWGIVFAHRTSIELYVVRASADTARLELVQSTPIGASVKALAVLRRASSSSDVLWIGFDKMRVVALTWNANTRSWVLEQSVNIGSMLGLKLCNTPDIMTSMDFADPSRKLLRGKAGDNACPLIRADPRGRCIAVLAGAQDVLYVVPSNVTDENTGGQMANSDEVFLIDLKASYNAMNIKDIVFLQGTFEPNIVVLCEPKRTWSGRAAVHRNSSHLLCISIDVRSKRHSKTWLMEKLPYDSLKLEPVPESAEGGVLLLAPNVILQVRHGACVAGLSLNCFGDAYAAELKGTYDAIRASENLLALDAGHCRFMDWEEAGISAATQNTALLSLKGGELYFLTLATGSNNSLELQRAGSTVLASEIVPVNDRFFVLASRLSDSLLVEYQRSANDESRPHKGGGSVSKADGIGNKSDMADDTDDDAELEIYGTKLTKSSGEETHKKEANSANGTLELVEKDEGTRGVYDDEDELGWVFNMSIEDEKASKASIRAGKWALKVKDTLPCFGPGMDLTVGLCPGRADNAVLDMVIAGGYAKNGCLAVVHQSVRPVDSARFELKGCTGVWTLRDQVISHRKAEERKARNKAILARNESLRASNAKRVSSRKRFIDDLISKYVKAQQKERLKKTKEEAVEQVTVKADGSETKEAPSNLNGDRLEKKRKVSDDEAELDPKLKRIKIEADSVSVEANKEPEKGKTKQLSEAVEVPAEILNQAEVKAAADKRFEIQVEEALEPEVPDEHSLDAYMLLSTDSTTVVLSAGSSELKEVVDKGVQFITREATIYAGNILNEQAYVQVTNTRIRVLVDGKMKCEHERPSDSASVVDVQVMDPHVLLVTADGRCFLFTITAESFSEPVEDSENALEESDMDTFIDEYGNESPAKRKANPKHANGKVKMRTGLRKFAVSLNFESPAPSGSFEYVNCACLYHGKLAAEVVRDVSSSDESKVESTTQYDVAKSEGAMKLEQKELEKPAIKEEVSSSVKKKIDIDEDGMLYGDGDDIDNEEELMLYGDGKEPSPKAEETVAEGIDFQAIPGQKKEGISVEPKSVTKDSSTTRREHRPVEEGVLLLNDGESSDEGVLLVTSTKSGALEMRARALDFAVVLRCDHFFAAPSVVNDSVGISAKLLTKLRAPKPYRIRKLFFGEVPVSPELPSLSSPLLVAIAESGLPLVYTGYLSQTRVNKSSTKMRSRLHLRRFTPTNRSGSIFARSISETQSLRSSPSTSGDVKCTITPFYNIGGRSGLFISGSVPFFIFAERGFPRIHGLYNKDNQLAANSQAPQSNSILSFAELSVVNCRRGFVSVASNGIIRIGELAPPGLFNFDSPSPMRKIALRCTPHKVAYHAGSATYGVLASMPTLTTREERLARILQSLEKHDKRHYQHTVAQAEAETGDSRKNRVPPLYEELHELRVYRADSWELIKSYKLQKGEVGLAIANMNVNVYKQRLAGPGVDIPSSHRGEDGNESLFAASLKLRPKNMLVVGTGYVNGEDATSRGRLLLFEVSRQELCMADEVHTAFQLQLVAEKQLPSPVTAVASMEGYVICGVGPQVSVYKLVGDEIVHLSFAFGQLFCTSISTLKQYVVTGDIRKSISFMYFRDRNSSVNFLGKDYEHVTTYATEFLVRNDELSIVLSDFKGNIHALNYVHASVPESRGGKRLLTNGGIAYGSQINKFVRVRVQDDKASVNPFRDTGGGNAGCHALAFATLDGGIGMVVAVSKEQFEMMQALVDAVDDTKDIARYCGIEPDLVKQFSPESSSTELLSQRLVDSRSAFHFFSLNSLAARKISRELGTDVGKIAGMMTEVDSVLQTFG